VCALVASSGVALALQPEEPASAAPVASPIEPTQPEAPPFAPANAAELLARTRLAYRAGGVAQRGSITLDDLPARPSADSQTPVDATDRARVRSRWSPIAFALMPAPGAEPPVASVRLGAALLMEVAPDALRVVHVANSSIYFQHDMDRGAASFALSSAPSPLAELERVLPPIPLPPLAWALAGDHPSDASHGFWSLDHVRWDDALVHGEAGLLIATGQGRSGPVELGVAADDFTLRRLTVALGSPQVPVRLTLKLDAPAPAKRLGLPDLASRTRVERISELRSRLPEIPIGSRLPSLALMGPGLSAWSLEAAIDAVTPPPALAGAMAPTRGVIILYSIDDREPEATLVPVHAAARVALDLAQEFERRSAQGSRSLPTMLVAAALVTEVGQIDATTLDNAARDWSKAQAPQGVTLLASSGGTQLISRLLPGASAVAVVVDHELTVLGKVQLDGGRDPDSVAAALRDLLEPRS
jgi:hypothetical protein